MADALPRFFQIQEYCETATKEFTEEQAARNAGGPSVDRNGTETNGGDEVVLFILFVVHSFMLVYLYIIQVPYFFSLFMIVSRT